MQDFVVWPCRPWEGYYEDTTDRDGIIGFGSYEIPNKF
jgi:hypothetical protein